MPRFLVLALVLVGYAPLAAAQSSSSAPSAATAGIPKDKDAVVFNEVEKGFFIGLQVGPEFLLNAPESTQNLSAASAATGKTVSKGPFSSGQEVMVELGFDIGDYVALGIFALVDLNRADSNYYGYSARDNAGNQITPVSGDFTTFSAGIDVRAKFVGIEDSQQVKRTWFYIRAGVGYAFFTPKPLLPNSDFLVFVGPGVEYYTRLRHFSIGVEAVGTGLISSKSFGFAVTPNLRYAF